jgi:hypothetical protein
MYVVIKDVVARRGFDYTMMIDDDVLIPSDILVPFEEFDAQDQFGSRTKVLAFTIGSSQHQMVDKYGHLNYLVHFQDLEYKISGHQKLLQSKFGSALFCHGAISVWDVPTVIQVLSKHNGTHHGDDLQMGLILQAFKSHYRIKAIGYVCVQTNVPEHYICSDILKCSHPEPSHFKQRANGWELSGQRFLLKKLKLLFSAWQREYVLLKFILAWDCWSVITTWISIPFLIGYIITGYVIQLITALLIVYVVEIFVLLFFNFYILYNRPDLRTGYNNMRAWLDHLGECHPLKEEMMDEEEAPGSSNLPDDIRAEVRKYCMDREKSRPWQMLVNRQCLDILLYFPMYRLYNRLLIMPMGAAWNIYKYLPWA